MRLDFSSFVITGPSTSSVSLGLMLAGEYNPGGVAVSDRTQCQTDTFTITNQVTVPMICGTNSGFHGNLIIMNNNASYKNIYLSSLM